MILIQSSEQHGRKELISQNCLLDSIHMPCHSCAHTHPNAHTINRKHNWLKMHLFLMLGIEPRALSILSTYSTTEPHSHPKGQLSVITTNHFFSDLFLMFLDKFWLKLWRVRVQYEVYILAFCWMQKLEITCHDNGFVT